MRPGSQAVEGVFDYFQEGLHVPPVKPWKGGEEQEDILAIILANTRMAESMLGDLRAQRNSLRVGELRIVELARRYGHEVVQAAMAEIMDRTEAKVRDAIRTIPNGVYPFEDYMDDSGPGTPPMRLEVTVTVRDDDILIDFDGTGPQTESGMNSYLNYTRSYCYAAVKCLTDPGRPAERRRLPPGADRGARAARSSTRGRPAGRRAARRLLLPDLRRGDRRARPALPGRVTAAGSHFANPTCGGFDPRRSRRTVVYELILSGTAARADRDGCEAMSMAFNASNIPVESQEANQPVLIERFELIRDSAGAGRYRGGTGIRRDLRFFLEGGRLTNNTERHRFGPWGLFGGQPGSARRHAGESGHARGAARPLQGLRHGRRPATWCRSSSPGPAATARPGSETLGRCSATSSRTTCRSRARGGTTASSSIRVTMTVDEAATANARAAMRQGDPGPAVSRLGPLW